MGRWLERLRERDDEARGRGTGSAALAAWHGEPSTGRPEAPRLVALAVEGGCNVPPPSIVSGPGVTVGPPAVEIPTAEYDRHLDALIAAAGADTPEASRLAYVRRKGWVVPRGDGKVFTRGR